MTRILKPNRKVRPKRKHIVHDVFLGKLHKHNPDVSQLSLKLPARKKKLNEKNLTSDRIVNLNSPEVIDKKAKHLHNDFKKANLSEDEKASINHYTGRHYENINGHFHGDELNPDRSEEDRHNLRCINDLSSALKKSKLSRNMHVYSGMRSPENLEKSDDGRIHVHNRAFTSTSIHPRIGRSFAKQSTVATDKEKTQRTGFARLMRNSKGDTERSEFRYSHVAKIHVPAGSHGLYIEHLTRQNGEHEYLLHHGSRVSFHPTPTIDHEARVVVWHGRLEHDGIAPTRHAHNRDQYRGQMDLFKNVKHNE